MAIKLMNNKGNKAVAMDRVLRPSVVGFLVGGLVVGHPLVSHYNHCSPTAPPIYPKMEYYSFKMNWKLKIALTMRPISGVIMKEYVTS